MAVAFDTFSDANEFTAATDPKTWTHTPTGTPRGVLVFTQNTGTTADWVNGTVSYGGVAMTRVATNGWAVDSAAETASIHAYFLGTGIPTGAQTVSIDHNNAIFGTKWACCVTLTGALDTEVVASGKIEADTANPSIALDSGSRTAIKLFNLFSGADAIASITNPAGITRIIAAKYASEIRCRVVGYRTTPGTGSETVSQTAASDDVAMIGVAVSEVVVTPPVAAFSADVTSGEAPLTVTFTDASTNTPTSWAWDFGDSVGTSTSQNPSYEYTDAGTYTVSLTATNAGGSDDEVKVGYIEVTAPADTSIPIISLARTGIGIVPPGETIYLT